MYGRKRAGCCSHVATVIYYFSYAKYRDIKLPGEHLNSVFIDIKNNEAPNEPRYVRAKRRRVIESESDSSSTEADSNEEVTISAKNDHDLNSSDIESSESESNTKKSNDSVNIKKHKKQRTENADTESSQGFKCNLCDKMCKNKTGLNMHKTKIHKTSRK